jgi:thioredoxin 1
MEQNFNDLIQGETPVLVDVFADWCGPCQAMMPEIDAYAKSIGDKARVLKVNIDRNPSLGQAFQIRGVPTLLLFKSGKLVWRGSGWHSQAQLASIVAPHVEG